MRSRRTRRSAATLLLCVAATCGATGLAAQSVSVTALIDRSVAESQRIEDARDAVADALEAISPSLGWDATRLSLSSSVRYTPNAPIDPVAPQASASVSLPLVPQVSVSGGVSTDFESVTSSVGVALSPLAARSVTYRERETYERALLQLALEDAQLPYQVESAAYAVVTAKRAADLAEDRREHQAKRFADSAEQYEIGDIGWSDYESAAEDLSAAERTLFDAERSLFSARVSLVDLVGPELGSLDIDAPPIETLERDLESRRRAVNSGGYPVSAAVITAAIERRSLEGLLSETRLFAPDISLRADSGMPFESVSASISITLSPAQYQREEREELQESITEAREAEILEEMKLDFEIDMLDRRMESAEKLYESSVASVGSAERSLAEAMLRYKHGEIGELALEEARLSLRTAENRRFQNAVDLLSVYGDALEYIDLSDATASLR